MFNKLNRLKRPKDFDHLFKKGASQGNKSLVLRYVKTDSDSPLKMAFIVSKKTEKSAVKRNRARRQLKEIVRKHRELFPDGYNMSFVIKKPFLSATSQEQLDSVLHLINKAKLN